MRTKQWMEAWPTPPRSSRAPTLIRVTDRLLTERGGDRGASETRHPERFDHMLRLLAAATAMPVAAYCPVADGRFERIQWVGPAEPSLRALTSLLQQTLVQPDVLVVADARTGALVEPADPADPAVTTTEPPAPAIGYFAGVSIRTRAGQVLGVLCVTCDEPRSDGERMRALLMDARWLMEREALLRRQAARDALTGLRNRRAVESSLQREWRRAVRERSSLSLLAFDVDYFKAFNDHYGHPAGDIALREVANVLSRSLRRPGDFVGRVGGEEFLACLPRTDAAGAVMAAELIRLEVERLGLPHEKSPIGVLTISVGTVSVGGQGIARLRPPGLVEMADAALYRAKERGRNCVAFIDEGDFDPMQDVVARF